MAAVCTLSAAAAAASPTEVAAPTQPLTLAQAHAIALRNHPDIAAANYRALAEHEVFVQSGAGVGSGGTRFRTFEYANSAPTSRTARIPGTR